METDKVIREMEKRGYTVSDESGVLMFTGLNVNIDESIADIKKTLAALEFKGSWGTKGYPKGKAPKDTGTVLLSQTGDTGTVLLSHSEDAASSADDDDASGFADDDDRVSADHDDAVHVTEEPSEAGGFSQMTFDFS